MEVITNVLLAVIALELAVLITIVRTPKPGNGFPHQQAFALSNYCAWTYENGRWSVVEDRSLPGYHCGDPPSRFPSYPEEVIRKPSTRIR